MAGWDLDCIVMKKMASPNIIENNGNYMMIMITIEETLIPQDNCVFVNFILPFYIDV
jgi:hypothetical protein